MSEMEDLTESEDETASMMDDSDLDEDEEEIETFGTKHEQECAAVTDLTESEDETASMMDDSDLDEDEEEIETFGIKHEQECAAVTDLTESEDETASMMDDSDLDEDEEEIETFGTKHEQECAAVTDLNEPKDKFSVQSSSTNKLDTSLKSFYPFSRIPKELRLSIWEMAIPQPRVLTLETFAISRCWHSMVRVRSDMVVPDRCEENADPDSCRTICTGISGILPQDLEVMDEVRARIEEDDQFGFSSQTEPPAMLFACHESNQVASKRYKRAFPTVGAVAETYFDYERDTLYLPMEQIRIESAGDPSCRLIVRSEACYIRNLALKFDYSPVSYLAASNRTMITTFIHKLLKVFRNVQTLTIVIDDYSDVNLDGGMNQKQRSKELILFEPIDIAGALHMFDTRNGTTIDLYKGLLLESRGQEYLGVSMDYLEEIRLSDENRGSVWNLPVIQWNMITTATFKTNFDALQKEYEDTTGEKCCREKDANSSTIDPRKLRVLC